jgi:CYTH domain-containing protein
LWHVDVYCGLLQGTVLAEVELKDESQELTLPAWVGKEVTGDPFYRKVNMRARALKRASAAAASIQSAPG